MFLHEAFLGDIERHVVSVQQLSCSWINC